MSVGSAGMGSSGWQVDVLGKGRRDDGGLVDDAIMAKEGAESEERCVPLAVESQVLAE